MDPRRRPVVELNLGDLLVLAPSLAVRTALSVAGPDN